MGTLVNLLENLFDISISILFLSTIVYLLQLKKAKRARKLSSMEHFMYIVIRLAYFTAASSYVLLLLDKHY
ncbi:MULTISPECIES: hypothetical protein [Bacillales]|uniref:Uncharacterized protein n=1 Tax=Lysinibacillus halotolerans TaxID=1368476 RepID=A0A3M8H3Y9_9BACI|nr:hypothetical protein [Lysinibacillus halotolerans]RNC97187.1 hypothetical protein EC501_16505 [Lysinibacillus halotolerans]